MHERLPDLLVTVGLMLVIATVAVKTDVWWAAGLGGVALIWAGWSVEQTRRAARDAEPVARRDRS